MTLKTAIKARLQFEIDFKTENWNEVINTGSTFYS